MDTNSSSSGELSFRGGLLAALVAFALTWFVVNGGEVSGELTGAVPADGHSVCIVPQDIPTSRFFNAPVPTPVPWFGS